MDQGVISMEKQQTFASVAWNRKGKVTGILCRKGDYSRLLLDLPVRLCSQLE